MRKYWNKKSALITGVLTVALAAVAFAYWTAGGSGSGTGGTADGTSAVTVNGGDASGLAPGVEKSLSGTFDNPNAGSVFIKSVTASISSVTPAEGKTCAASNYEISGTSNEPGLIASGNPVGSWNGLKVKMINDLENSQDGCQGATVNIAYTASGS